MDIQSFAQKYGIDNLDDFKQDLLDHFAKSNEFKTKRDEVMKTFDELQKKIQDTISNLAVAPVTPPNTPVNNLVSVSEPIVPKPRNKKSDLGPFASKAAKEYAEENGIDPESVTGTGQTGITKGDLLKLTKSTVRKTTKKSKKNNVVTKNCNGVLASGESCHRNGQYEIEDRWYCGFHKDQGKKKETEPMAVDSEDELDYETENEVNDLEVGDTNVEDKVSNSDDDEIPSKIEDEVLKPEPKKLKKRIIKKRV